jgi:hypothetical protein
MARFRFPAGTRDFFFATASRLARGATQPPIELILRALSPRVKRSRREADNSPPSSAKVKNGGAILPLPLYTYSWRFEFRKKHARRRTHGS